MLTVGVATVPGGGAAAAAGAWGVATEVPVAAEVALAEEEAVGGGACWRRRARWPSLTIWMMASASASNWRTAAWMLLAEPRLVEPGRGGDSRWG